MRPSVPMGRALARSLFIINCFYLHTKKDCRNSLSPFCLLFVSLMLQCLMSYRQRNPWMMILMWLNNLYYLMRI